MQADIDRPQGARRFRYRWIVAALVAVAGIVAASLLVGTQYATEQTAKRSFVLDLDFSRVRRILMSTDANEQIITLTGDSEFLDETWNVAGGKLKLANPLDPSWTLEMRGDLHVRTRDEYVGRDEIWLTQDVKIEPKELVSVTALRKGSQRLQGYRMITRYVPDAPGKTRVEQQLTQQILTTAPWFARPIADNRVLASATDSLVRQEAAIRNVIEKNKDRWLLPIP